MTTARKLAVLLAGITPLIVSCGSNKPSGTEVPLTLSEYAIKVGQTSIGAGKVTFKAENIGGAEHEIVVLALDDPKTLTIKADGSVDEEAIAETAKMGEVEHIASKTTKSNTFDLKAGTYVLMCNLVNTVNGTTVSHFVKGMVTTVVVA